MRKTLFTVTIIFLLTGPGFADIARPEKPVKKTAAVDTYLSIKLDRDAKEARLIVPRSQLKALRAELESIDGDSVTASASISRTQTIVSGLFISLAIVFGGIWFARSGKLSTKTAAIMAVAFAGGALATIVYGNAGPPSEARSVTGKMFAPAMHIYKFGGGKIKLEISDTEDQVQLIVPDPEEPKKPGEE